MCFNGGCSLTSLRLFFILHDVFKRFMVAFDVSQFIGRVVFLTEATIRVVSGVLAAMFLNLSCCPETGSNASHVKTVGF